MGEGLRAFYYREAYFSFPLNINGPGGKSYDSNNY